MTVSLYTEECGQISVCTDCAYVHSSGELPADLDTDSPEPWGRIGFGYYATAGGEHSTDCDEETRRETGCDCENLGFTWTSCDACGANRGGDRFAFTLWRTSIDNARAAHAEYIDAARRPDLSRAATVSLLDSAAQYRQYIARLLAEEHRFELWRARVAA